MRIRNCLEIVDIEDIYGRVTDHAPTFGRRNEHTMVHDAVAMLINNLRGISKTGDPIQYTPIIAMEKLKALTGEDFGYDADAWEKWFKELENSPKRFRKIRDNENPPVIDGDNNLKIE